MLRLASFLADNARPLYERIAAYLAGRLDAPVELLAGRLELDRLRDGEGQDVRGDLRRRCFDDVDLHGRARMLSEQVRTVFLE